MKKQELLTLYEQGERNFRRQNLSGQCFRGHNLSDADFSGAILKGTNFSQAILRGANFTAAQIGLRPLGALGLGLLLGLLAIVLGVVTGGVGVLLNLELPGYELAIVGDAILMEGVPLEAPVGWIMLLLLLAFALMVILEGIKTGFGLFALALGLAGGATVLKPLVGHYVDPVAFTIAARTALAITVLSVITALVLLATTVVIAAWRSLNSLVAISIALFYLITVWIVVYAAHIPPAIASVVPAILLLGSYLGWRALQDDPKHRILRQIAHALTRSWGTNFRNTDLTEATFAQAQFKNAHFEGAILTRVRWTDSAEPLLTGKG